MPDIGIEELQAEYVGWLDATLTSYSGIIDSRLAKRYAVPFVSPYPDIIKNWLVRLVNPRAYLKRGLDPSDKQSQVLLDDATAVLLELKEAADAVNGLYELPLRADDPSTSGITKPKILFRSDSTPYEWIGRQARRAYGR
jgi:hypothetical protein